MANDKPELRAEAIRLRLEERMSLREIHETTGASKGSLSSWLKPHPLTEEERRTRRARTRYRSPKKDRGTPSKHFLAVDTSKFTRIQKGKIAESAVLFRLVLHGFDAYGSTFDGDKIDWIVSNSDGKLLKVQVRWTKNEKWGLPSVHLNCRHGYSGRRRYKKGEFDFIVGYDLFTDTAYVWSWDEVAHLNTTVTICPEAAERWDKLNVLV